MTMLEVANLLKTMRENACESPSAPGGDTEPLEFIIGLEEDLRQVGRLPAASQGPGAPRFLIDSRTQALQRAPFTMSSQPGFLKALLASRPSWANYAVCGTLCHLTTGRFPS